jgi:hypothetical protein
MTLIIDPRFIDVDLEAEGRRLNIPKGYVQKPGETFTELEPGVMRSYGDEFKILPDAERKAAIEKLDADEGNERLIRWILNQGGEGSCVGNMWTQGIQFLLAKQFGEANAVALSAISAYKQIGRSPGSGAMVSDALDCGRDVGVLPLDTPENRARFGQHVMPPTGFYTPYPDGWKETAKQFRLVKTLPIRSVAEIEQAGINGHPIGVGRDGHSILYLRPTMKSGRGFLYVNSWGAWGFAAGGHTAGFGFDSARMVSSSAGWAYAFVSMTAPDYVLAA